MIRTVFIPQNESFVFPVPAEYIGKELEMIVFQKDEVLSKPLHFKDASAKQFVSRWAGFLKGADIDLQEAKYEYLSEKYTTVHLNPIDC